MNVTLGDILEVGKETTREGKKGKVRKRGALVALALSVRGEIALL